MATAPNKAQITISRDLYNQLRAAADERLLGSSRLAEMALADYLGRLVPVGEVVLLREPADAS